MNRSCVIALWMGVVCVGLAASAQAQESSSWKMPNLNPFKKAHPATGNSSVNPWVSSNEPAPSKWSMFSTTPKTNTGPSTWDKMSNSTKNGWYKFKDAVNPFDDANDPPKKPYNPFSLGSKGTTSSSSSGGYSGFSSTKSSTPKSSGSSFWPWSKSSEKESKPHTVNDFLSQQRPE